MYIPGFSKSKKLSRRKGGGGKGGGGKGGGGKGGGGRSSGSKNSGSSGSGGRGAPLSSVQGKTTSSYGKGGGSPSMISSGVFSGRSVGGGTRDNVYGNRVYGSGYPGVNTYGVAGRGFPFYYWPLGWGAGNGYGPGHLHNNEYGNPDNTSRPGGPMFQYTFTSIDQNTALYIVADNMTTVSLVQSVRTNCSSVLSNSASATPSPYNASDYPRPEQAVQYYRASSVALLLGLYNNTAALTDDQSATASPLPTFTDMKMLTCLNETIGAAVPLVDGAMGLNSTLASFGFWWVMWCMFWFY